MSRVSAPRNMAVPMAATDPHQANTAAGMALPASPMRNRMPVITLLIRNTWDTPVKVAVQKPPTPRAVTSAMPGWAGMTGWGRPAILKWAKL